jgi:hypothetical protein
MFDNLSLFAKLSVFLGMFFASTTVVPDGGGDVADDSGGGGDDGGDDAGDGGDQGDEGGEGEEAASDETGDEGDEETDEEAGGGEVEKPDTRAVSAAQIKKAIDELKKIDPKVAEIARRGIYENGDYRRAVGSVAQARELADTFESLGGHEGIADMQQEVGDYAQELTSMAQGDPSVIEDLARDFPGGLVKLVPHAVDKLQTVDPGAYEHLAARIVSGTFQDKGVASRMDRLAELISDGKQREAFELTKQIREWMSAVKGIAGQRPQSREETPEARQARETLEAANTKEMNIFRGQVAGVVIKGMNEAITKALAPQIKSLKLTTPQKDALQNRVRTRLASVFERDDRYQDRMAQLLRAGDINAIRRFLRGRLDRNMVRKAVARELALGNFRVKRAPAAAASAGGSNASGTVLKVAKKPTPDQIDWSRDRGRMRFTKGEATLKNGKTVRWNWDEQ